MSDDEGDRVEESYERDARIYATMVEAIRDCIDNVPQEVVKYDEQGRIVSIHPVEWDGMELNVRTKRGLFAVSIYPAPFRRTEEEPERR